MDNDKALPEVQREQPSIHTSGILTEVDVTDGKEMEDIWNHLKDRDEIFDDFSKDRLELWIMICMLPTTKLFRIRDVGVLQLNELRPPLGATVHHVLWGALPPSERAEAMTELFRLAFEEWKLRRLTTVVPVTNPIAKRVALSAGFRFEGCLRQSFLKNGRYHDVDIFGMLSHEYEARKRSKVV
jgi:hypothetical protein